MQNSEKGNRVYRELSMEMRNGLKTIYRQISTVSRENTDQAAKTDELFTEASDQLNEVVQATENAAMSIMEIVENHMDLAQESNDILARLKEKLPQDEDISRLAAIGNQVSNDLTTVLTALSFQDITGQRIKRVVESLQAIENSVVDLYISSGLVMEGAEKEPQKEVEELQQDAKRAVEEFREKTKGSELKGPDKNTVSQGAIDDMLAQLGL